ncbi:hypothetical protein EK904_010078 [Melospiza melodia maxima]|nr:hypothetical protein EK904_010078 [Melospiza melodia maxima]
MKTPIMAIVSSQEIPRSAHSLSLGVGAHKVTRHHHCPCRPVVGASTVSAMGKMSGKKGRDKEGCFALASIDFKNALEQFQNLVEKMIIQKTKESSGLYTKDDDEINYEKFYKTTRTLFGSAVKDQDIQAFFRKIISNPDERPEWLEVRLSFRKMKSNVLSLTVVKRKDVLKGILNVPNLHLTVTASQKGLITVFSEKRKSFSSYSFYFHQDTAWITGCDFLPNLKYIVAATESTVILWDYKSNESEGNGFVIKPMKNCLLCVSTVTMADNLPRDTILLGDDKGYVYLLTITTDDFIMKQTKGGKVSQFKVMDAESFDMPRRKLHDDWVGKVKYFPALKRFGSCSTDGINSFVLDDIKRLEDHLPVKEFSVPKGVNAFTYCGKAKVIVTGDCRNGTLTSTSSLLANNFMGLSTAVVMFDAAEVLLEYGSNLAYKVCLIGWCP